jgi:hypothetical protein
MARTRSIDSNPTDMSCDVCGRTLLRGERAEPFLAGGARRQVCELCTVRAQHEGWIRESGADELGVRTTRAESRGPGFLERLRARRERARELEAEAAAAEEAGIDATPEPEPAPAPRRPRQVRAVPTNAELKVERALELFNASDHPRTVGGVARSLGAPAVCARPALDRPSVVTITVTWELSWYRYEVDLSDEAGEVRRIGQGSELEELDPEELVANAAADERGRLAPAALDG